MGKTKAHTRYKNKANKVVPGVTTIIGGNLGWNTQVLIAWARRTALAGEDPDKVRDKAADIGTLAHALIEEHITTSAPHLEPVIAEKAEYSQNDLDIAENAFLAYLEWENRMGIDLTDERVRAEERLVSEWLQYGGTLDFIAPIQGVLSLIDFKSTNGLYPEHRIQLAAYGWLYEENYGEALPLHLLQVSKTEGDFHHHKFDDLSDEFEVYRLLRRIHALGLAIKKR